MDDIDRKILDLLQQDASMSIAQIGDRVGLSQTPCWKRIQRLEQQGVLVRRVALLSPEKLGLGLTVFVSVETADHSAEWLARFADLISARPEVLEVYRMAGDVDYMLRIVVPDMVAYDEFYRELIGSIPLKNVTSRFAMERVKSTTAMPDRQHDKGNGGQKAQPEARRVQGAHFPLQTLAAQHAEPAIEQHGRQDPDGGGEQESDEGHAGYAEQVVLDAEGHGAAEPDEQQDTPAFLLDHVGRQAQAGAGQKRRRHPVAQGALGQPKGQAGAQHQGRPGERQASQAPGDAGDQREG